jgi:hypothetical protein
MAYEMQRRREESKKGVKGRMTKTLTFRAVWSGKKSDLALAPQMLVPHLEQKEWAIRPWLKV